MAKEVNKEVKKKLQHQCPTIKYYENTKYALNRKVTNITDNPRKCKHGKCKTNLMYILRAIVMLFLRAKVIPVSPQIHANVCAYFFFWTIVFIHVSDIVLFLKFLLGIHSLIKYVHIVNAELIESTLKQTIMCLCFDDFFNSSRNIKKWCVHIICIARFIWLMFILKKYR
jgi:hypothetical protein